MDDLDSQIKILKKDLCEANDKYLKAVNLKISEKNQIQTDVEKMFPKSETDLEDVKKKLVDLQSIKPAGVSEILKQLYFEMMNRDRLIPQLTEIDFTQMNTDDIVSGIKTNYEYLVTSTIKSIRRVKTGNDKTNASVQTLGLYIDPKKFEEINKLLDKAVLAGQSSAMQLDKCKHDLKAAVESIEKYEIEKIQHKNEFLALKNEFEYKCREILLVRNELENKKTESALHIKQNVEKIKEVDLKDKKIVVLETENTDLKVKIDRLRPNKNEPVSSRPLLRKNIEENESIDKPDDKKKPKKLSSAEKAELEKLYNTTLTKIKNSSANITEKNEKADNHKKGLEVPYSLLEDDGKMSENSKTFKIFDEKNDDEDFKNHLVLENYDNTEENKDSNNKRTSLKLKGNPKDLNKTHTKTIGISKGVNSTIKSGNKNKKNFTITTNSEEPKLEPNFHNKKSKNSKKSGKKQSFSNISDYEIFDSNKHSEDKCCGNEKIEFISIGIQIGPDTKEDTTKGSKPRTYSFNPNNIYGLHGDIYYHNQVFQPQNRMPEEFEIFKPPFLIDTNSK